MWKIKTTRHHDDKIENYHYDFGMEKIFLNRIQKALAVQKKAEELDYSKMKSSVHQNTAWSQKPSYIEWEELYYMNDEESLSKMY